MWSTIRSIWIVLAFFIFHKVVISLAIGWVYTEFFMEDRADSCGSGALGEGLAVFTLSGIAGAILSAILTFLVI